MYFYHPTVGKIEAQRVSELGNVQLCVQSDDEHQNIGLNEKTFNDLIRIFMSAVRFTGDR